MEDEKVYKKYKIDAELQKGVYKYLKNKGESARYLEIETHLENEGFKEFQLISVLESLVSKGVVNKEGRGVYSLSTFIGLERHEDKFYAEILSMLRLYKPLEEDSKEYKEMYENIRGKYVDNLNEEVLIEGVKKGKLKAELHKEFLNGLENKGNVKLKTYRNELKLKGFVDDEVGGCVRALRLKNRVAKSGAYVLKIENNINSLKSYLDNLLIKYDFTLEDYGEEGFSEDFISLYKQLRMLGDNLEETEETRRVVEYVYNKIKTNTTVTRERIFREVNIFKGVSGNREHYGVIYGLRNSNRIRRKNDKDFIVLPENKVFKLRGRVGFLIGDYISNKSFREELGEVVKEGNYTEYVNKLKQVSGIEGYEDEYISKEDVADYVIGKLSEEEEGVYNVIKQHNGLLVGEARDYLISQGVEPGNVGNLLSRSLVYKRLISKRGAKVYAIGLPDMETSLREDIKEMLSEFNLGMYDNIQDNNIKELKEMYSQILAIT